MSDGKEEKRKCCLSQKGCNMLAVTVFVSAVLVIITVTSLNRSPPPDPAPEPSFPTGGDMLDYLLHLGYIDKKDGLQVSWYHSANKKHEMEQALQSDAMVLEADVNLEGYNTANQTSIPVMAHPPAIYSDNTLQQWLEAVLKSKKGIKLDFKSLEAVGPSLDILINQVSKSGKNRPVWLNADILHGPNVPGLVPVVNATRFVYLIQEKFPNATISPGWKAVYLSLFPNKTYTRAMVEEMYEIIKNIPQKVTFPVRAVMCKLAWPHFSWLLKQSPSYSLTLWQGKDDPVSVDNLLFIRDNSLPEQIYYDIYEPVLSQFKEAAMQRNQTRRFYPGGDLVDYFKPENSDGLNIKWHTVGNGMALMSLLRDEDRGMLVITVGFREGSSEALMVESSTPELVLQDALRVIYASPKPCGIYLRIRSQDALAPTLRLLRQDYEDSLLHHPIWINMDIIYGGFQTPGYMDGEEFVATINDIFPFVTLAPGWPKELLSQGYTPALVTDMIQLFDGQWQEVSFQLQAVPLGKSVPGLRQLLQSTHRFSLTTEHQPEQGSYSSAYQGLTLIRRGKRDRVFYNLAGNYRSSFFTS
ncbi:protein FAM151A [Amia ocellicauda]|uniref:protein FAM151A n=1 Tax=Amia ocellicauda TaxID=2972642 RepID=UPI0034645B9F